jgi:hypothetical protein
MQSHRAEKRERNRLEGNNETFKDHPVEAGLRPAQRILSIGGPTMSMMTNACFPCSKSSHK